MIISVLECVLQDNTHVTMRCLQKASRQTHHIVAT